MGDRRYFNGRQVDADGLCILHRKPAADLPHAVSWSSGETFIRSRPTYHQKHGLGTLHTPSTPAMEFGSLAHLAVLEPDRFAAEVVCAPKFDRRTKAGKEAFAEFEAESAGKVVASPADYHRATGCRDSVWAHPVARALLTKPGIEFERETSWIDKRTGMEVFAHPDAIWPGGGLDLKTTRDVSQAKFQSSCEEYGYHRQAACYLLDASISIFGRPADEFFHIAVCSTAPYDVEVYAMDSVWIDDGATEFREMLDTLALCVEHNDWRSPGSKVGGAIELERPPWAAGRKLAFELPAERWGE